MRWRRRWHQQGSGRSICGSRCSTAREQPSRAHRLRLLHSRLGSGARVFVGAVSGAVFGPRACMLLAVGPRADGSARRQHWSDFRSGGGFSGRLGRCSGLCRRHTHRSKRWLGLDCLIEIRRHRTGQHGIEFRRFPSWNHPLRDVVGLLRSGLVRFVALGHGRSFIHGGTLVGAQPALFDSGGQNQRREVSSARPVLVLFPVHFRSAGQVSHGRGQAPLVDDRFGPKRIAPSARQMEGLPKNKAVCWGGLGSVGVPLSGRFGRSMGTILVSESLVSRA